MKKIASALLVGCLSLSAHAQSYDTLWKQVEAASEKDLPKSALASVEKIRIKAVAEKNDVQLLRATLMNLVFCAEISPDSIAPATSAMEEMLAAETRPVAQALWHSALAQTYKASADRSEAANYETQLQKSRVHAEASLVNAELLAEARVSDYLPLFATGKSSRFFNDDLLHVLFGVYKECISDKTQLAAMRSRVTAVYRSKGEDNAVIALVTDSLEQTYAGHKVKGAIEDDAYFRALSALHRAYPSAELAPKVLTAITDLHDCYAAESVSEKTYNACEAHNDSLLVALAEDGIKRYGKNKYTNGLRNFVNKMTAPEATIGSLPKLLTPGSNASLQLKSRHTEAVALRLTRVAADDMSRELKDEDLSRLAARNRKNAQLTTYDVPPAPRYAWSSRDISLNIPDQAGIYVAELLVGGKTTDTALLHVSALQAVVFAYPDGQNRVVAVDSRSGRPVAGAKITQMAYADGRYTQKKVYTCNAEGTVTIPGTERQGTFYAWTEADRAGEGFSVDNLRYYGTAIPTTCTTVDLFTDRSIYRPGQKVEVSGIAYTRTADEMHTEKAFRAKLTLYSASHKELDSLWVETDAYGMFSGSFSLPKSALPGTFSLRLAGASVNTSAYFGVEEYKRPTFTAATDPVRTAYAPGDTVQVCGRAETYTGVGVAGARVQYAINSQTWFRTSRGSQSAGVNGETVTDSEGRFCIPVVLSAQTDDAPQWARYSYNVSYTVTADNGESATGSATLQTASRRAWIEHNVPQTVCRESGKSLPAFCIRQVNASGEDMEAAGSYTLCNGAGEEVAQGTFSAGEPFRIAALSSLPEGMYALTMRTDGAEHPDTARFALFSEDVETPVNKKETLFAFDRYAEGRDSVHVMIGTPHKSVTLFVDGLAEGKLLASRRYELTDSVLHFRYAYKPEYGEGLTVYYAFVQDGTLYTHRVFVQKPVPQKKLNLTWHTFRSRLTPGAQETWTLRVTHADGTPAGSQVMAVLYDASLDALGSSSSSSWAFSHVGFSRSATNARWNLQRSGYTTSLSYGAHKKWFDVPSSSDFTVWNPELFSYYSTMVFAKLGSIRPLRAKRSMTVLSAKVSDRMAFDASEAYADNAYIEASNCALNEEAPSMGASAENSLNVRSNFAETAFFRPALHTDSEGKADISFTLPESTTQWHFKALAHTEFMEYGTLDTTAVARKEFMVQPALPRFLREGDSATLPVQLTNLTAKAVSATACMELRDALTDKVVYTGKLPVSLAAGEVKTVAFTYKATTDAAMLVCRVTAAGKGFSDGEEHALPVLSSRQEVTRTQPFSFTEKGNHTWKVDTLFNSASATHRSLTVELTSNPTWTAVSALPALAADASSVSATEWATRLYALCIGQHIAQTNPSIAKAALEKGEEVEALSRLDLDGFTELTPWLRNARQEQQRVASLRNLFDGERSSADQATALDKLRALQGTDGGWSWYPGMPANRYTTVDVATLLARIEKLTARYAASDMGRRAFSFLQQEIAKDVERMKRTERESNAKLSPSEFQLRYLYLRTLLGMKADDADSRFLLERAASLTKQLTMYGKALTAIVLAQNGRREAAQTTLQSLLEHTVATKEMGRYFDTPRAEWSWQSYRIPTECAAVEALDFFGRTDEAADMRLWLMQEKRTQMWETSRASADAVYALLASPEKSSNAVSLDETSPAYYTLLKGTKIVGFNARTQSATATTAAHFRQTYTEAPATEATTLKVRKDTDGLTWGAVYASFELPAAEVQTEGKGLQLTRRLEVMRANEWQPVASGTVLAKGDKVRQVFTLTADRDYDFVRLSASRPACLEPVHALSGCQWAGGLSTYRAVHDASTEFFIEQVHKGKHTLTEELRTDRAGTYTSGVSTVQSVYAPEFCATAAEFTLRVE